MSEQPERHTPERRVAALVAVMSSDHYPNGDRAALKRMSLDTPTPMAFHKLWLSQIESHIDEYWKQEHWQPAWRTLTTTLALQRGQCFDPKRPLGRVLHDARFAESRLERLLSADGDTLFRLALRAARQVAAQQLPADWRDLARLLFADGKARQFANDRLARAYYHAQYQAEHAD